MYGITLLEGLLKEQRQGCHANRANAEEDKMVSVYGAARKAQESQYRDLCTVYEYCDVTDEKSKLTRKEEVAVLEDIACRLSFELLYGVSRTDTGAEVAQRVKLFIAPEVKIPAGCRIAVTLSGGEVLDYGLSGAPAVYPTHQEIRLEPFKRWS